MFTRNNQLCYCHHTKLKLVHWKAEMLVGAERFGGGKPWGVTESGEVGEDSLAARNLLDNF
jgi:hypothetical protein